jgi:hypothetical protein
MQNFIGDWIELLSSVFRGDRIKHLSYEKFHFLVFLGSLIFVFVNEISFGQGGDFIKTFLLYFSHFLWVR